MTKIPRRFRVLHRESPPISCSRYVLRYGVLSSARENDDWRSEQKKKQQLFNARRSGDALENDCFLSIVSPHSDRDNQLTQHFSLSSMQWCQLVHFSVLQWSVVSVSILSSCLPLHFTFQANPSRWKVCPWKLTDRFSKYFQLESELREGSLCLTIVSILGRGVSRRQEF